MTHHNRIYHLLILDISSYTILKRVQTHTHTCHLPSVHTFLLTVFYAWFMKKHLEGFEMLILMLLFYHKSNGGQTYVGKLLGTVLLSCASQSYTIHLYTPDLHRTDSYVFSQTVRYSVSYIFRDIDAWRTWTKPDIESSYTNGWMAMSQHILGNTIVEEWGRDLATKHRIL